MSHTTYVKGLMITSPNAIRIAVKALQKKGLKLNLLENQVPKMYFPHQEQEIGKCEFVLKMEDSRLDVGLKYNKKNGEYELYYDKHANYIRNVIGYDGDDKPEWSNDQKNLAHIAKFNREYQKALISEVYPDYEYDVVEYQGDNDETEYQIQGV